MNAPVSWLLLSLSFAAAGDPGGTWLSFSLERTGAAPQRYTVRLEEGTGHGFYHADLLNGGNGALVAGSGETPIIVQPATLKKIFAAVPLVKSSRCDAHAKGIAQTGMKTLRYTADSGAFECTYNYGLDDRVNKATDLFEAVAETMQFGERLTSKLRFDRLGLDGVMVDLENALADGRAVEVNNIAPVLQAVQNDERVMEHVRRKAAHLLETAGSGSQMAGDKDANAR